jgi:hypothetical protein
MLIRGKIIQWFVKPDEDATWNEEDWGRASILESRWASMGISENERRKLIPCGVLLKKYVGIVFSPEIMTRLKELSL